MESPHHLFEWDKRLPDVAHHGHIRRLHGGVFALGLFTLEEFADIDAERVGDLVHGLHRWIACAALDLSNELVAESSALTQRFLRPSTTCSRLTDTSTQASVHIVHASSIRFPCADENPSNVVLCWDI